MKARPQRRSPGGFFFSKLSARVSHLSYQQLLSYSAYRGFSWYSTFNILTVSVGGAKNHRRVKVAIFKIKKKWIFKFCSFGLDFCIEKKRDWIILRCCCWPAWFRLVEVLWRYKLGVCMSHLNAVRSDHGPHLHQQPPYQGPEVHTGSAGWGDWFFLTVESERAMFLDFLWVLGMKNVCI